MHDTNTAKGNMLPNEVHVELDVLRPSMMNRVGGEVDRGDVVTVDKCGLGDLTVQLLEQLSKPGALHYGIGNNPVLGLSARS